MNINQNLNNISTLDILPVHSLSIFQPSILVGRNMELNLQKYEE